MARDTADPDDIVAEALVSVLSRVRTEETYHDDELTYYVVVELKKSERGREWLRNSSDSTMPWRLAQKISEVARTVVWKKYGLEIRRESVPISLSELYERDPTGMQHRDLINDAVRTKNQFAPSFPAYKGGDAQLYRIVRNDDLKVEHIVRPPVTRTDAGEPAVPIFYTTERALTRESPPTFAKRSDWAMRRFGRCDVRFPASYRVTPPVGNFLYAVLAKLSLDGKRKPRIHANQALDEAAFHRNLLAELQNANSGSVLVYVHGATVDLEGGVLQAAIVALNTNFPGPTIAYCWPAHDYASDVELAPQEARHFGAWLVSLQSHFPDANIHVVAHSLGSVVAMKGVADTVLVRKIGEFTVAAPDIDRRVYRELAPLVLAQASRGTVYVSEKDAALNLSGKLRLSVARVGSSVKFAVGHGFDVIDAAKHGGDGTFTQHDVAFRGPLCRDLAETLRGIGQIRTTLEVNPPGAKWYQLRK